MPQLIQFHPLWRDPNGPMPIFPKITMFLAVLENPYNGQDASNGHIASPWRSASLHCFAIPTRFKLCKPAFCEVIFGTSYTFSIFAFFLLSFLDFFPVMYIFGFLFPLLFLSFHSIVNSHYWGSFTGFEGNTSCLTISRVGALLFRMDKFFKTSCILSTLTARSLALSYFDFSICSSIKRDILLAM
jgi:hypothetical protein